VRREWNGAASWIAVVAVLGTLVPLPAVAAAAAVPVEVAWATPEADRVVVWVRFRDRGSVAALAPEARRALARSQVSARSLERRARRGGALALESDLPVYRPYVDELARHGFRVRGTSRWLNAASVATTRVRLDDLRALPFVGAVEPVARHVRGAPSASELRGEVAPGGAPRVAALVPGTPEFYGPSWAQNRTIQADQLHAAGLSGAGVIVAILDTGFREINVALDSIAVVARRDFIQGDEVVANEAGDAASQDAHGTYILSALAGREIGVLVGPGFGASVALAKTEEVSEEVPVEMDYWQMAAEWADSLGADVISASLGYFAFDDPDASYEYADMDGRTTVVTRAAVEASARGITVVTAMGNEGNTPWHYLIAPADAESTLAVGAVDSFAVVAGFSGYGPTADGRTKPDVCAMGVRVHVGTPAGSFGRVDGTSAATPLIAGLVAMLLEAHPTWGPFEIVEALRATADQAGAPDTQRGFGVARGALAVEWIPSTVDTQPGAGSGRLVALGPNPARAGQTSLRLRMGDTGGRAVVALHDARGRRVRTLLDEELPARAARAMRWDGADERGQRASAGMYWACFLAPGVRDTYRFVFVP
jgi:hypothetical protein